MHAITFIEKALESGGKILVHCAAGVSRSSTVVLAYLMYKNRWGYERALEYGKSKRDRM